MLTKVRPHLMTRERYDARLKELYGDFDNLYQLAAKTDKGAAVNLSHRINGTLSVLLDPTAIVFEEVRK